MDNSNISSDLITGNIETNSVGELTSNEPQTKQASTDHQNSEINDSTANEIEEFKATDTQTKVNPDRSLDDIIIKALEKVKEYFIQNEMEEHKLAEFMYKILTLNMKGVDLNGFETNTDLFDSLVDQMIETSKIKNDSNSFNGLLDNLFGEDGAKTINEKLCTENIDEIVEFLLGKDTKNIICNRLESDNLDELLNKLIEEKLSTESNPHAKHPNFDEFIEKILGKDTKEFIRQKLQSFINETDNIDNSLDLD